jgi:hypothetical protein
VVLVVLVELPKLHLTMVFLQLQQLFKLLLEVAAVAVVISLQ